jgi:hypothetical protein
MEIIDSSETSAGFQRTTRRYIQEDRTLYNHLREYLKFCFQFRWQHYLAQITPSETYSPQLAKDFPTFYGRENLLLLSQKPATEACPEPNESCSHAHILFLYYLFEYYSITYVSFQFSDHVGFPN